MTLIGAICYGIIQGLAEFLPISSSGHLALAQNFHIFSSAAEANDMTFNVLLHFGTLASVLVVYRNDVICLVDGFWCLIKRPFSKSRFDYSYNEKLFLCVAVASIPLVPAALLADKIEALSQCSFAIGIFLMLNGVILWLSEKLSNGKTSLCALSGKKALLIGAFQMFGVLPGISRSGSTITGGLVCDFAGEDAVRFSFLMSIPAILGAGILKLSDLGSNVDSGMIGIYIAGALSAAIVGALSIKFLQYIAKDKSFLSFSIYSIIIGALALIFDLA